MSPTQNRHTTQDVRETSSRGRLALLGGAVILIVGIPIVLFTQGGEETESANPHTPPTAAPTGEVIPDVQNTLSEAKPSSSLERTPGCHKPDQELVDILMGTLKNEGGSVELSATWHDDIEGEDRDVAALMVRNREGTIDQPYLVWAEVEGEWSAATPSTAEATNAPDASDDLATSVGVSGAITCLTAGSR